MNLRQKNLCLGEIITVQIDGQLTGIQGLQVIPGPGGQPGAPGQMVPKQGPGLWAGQGEDRSCAGAVEPLQGPGTNS